MGACATKPKAVSDPADAPPPLLSREVDEAACAVTEAKGEQVKADANPDAKGVDEEKEDVDDGSRRRSLGHLLKENEEEKKSESTEADKPAPTEEPKQVTPEAQPQPPNAETIAATTATEVKAAEPEQPPKHAVVEEVKVQEEQGEVQETKVPIEATVEPTKAAEVAAAVEVKEEKPELPVSQAAVAAVAEEKH